MNWKRKVDRLQVIAEAMSQWAETAYRRVSKTKIDIEYHKASSDLLDLTGAFMFILHDFSDILSDESADICIHRTISSLALVKSHTRSSKLFNAAGEEARRSRLAEVKIMKSKALDELILIINEYDFPNLPNSY